MPSEHKYEHHLRYSSPASGLLACTSEKQLTWLGEGRKRLSCAVPFPPCLQQGLPIIEISLGTLGWGGITAGTSSCPHLEPPNLLFAYCMVKQTAFNFCWVCGIMIHLAGNLSARCKARSCITTLLASSQKNPTGLGRIRPPPYVQGIR